MNEETSVAALVPHDAQATSAVLPQPGDWRTLVQMGTELYKSGILPAHIKSPAAAIAVIQLGLELNLRPMNALTRIQVIQGKPTCSAELMRSLILRDHGDDAFRFAETDAEHCVVEYKRRTWKQTSRYIFTMKDAERAGIADSTTWRKYPAAMLRARATTDVARMDFPDTISGMYSAEELGAQASIDDLTGGERFIEPEPIARPGGEIVDTVTGEIIESEPVAAQAVQHATEDNTPFEAEEPEVEAPTGGLLANPNQLKAIRQLSNQLGHPEMPSETMTYAEAETRIRELTAEGNAQKRNGGRA